MTIVGVVRPATAEDLADVVAIERASFGDPWSEASFRAMLNRSGVTFLVSTGAGAAAAAAPATEGRAVVLGYAVAVRLDDEAEVTNIAVAEGARRRGLGARLLDAMLAALTAAGVRTVFLEVRAGNAAAQRLYAGRGFVELSRRRQYYAKPVEDAVVMVRR